MDIEIIDQVFPPLRRGKNLWQIFGVASVSTDKQYFFQPDQQIKANVITGFDVGYFSGVAWNMPAQINVNGKTYNTITLADMNKVLVTFRDHQNNFILRRMPLFVLTRDLKAEIKIFDTGINIDSSYIEFVETPLATALPMIIPFNFYWNG